MTTKRLRTPALHELGAHLKLYHQLRPSDTFLCLECSHSFQSLNAFKRHFNNKETCLEKHSANFDFVKENELVDCNVHKPPINKKPKLDNIQAVMERIETSALLFVSDLHNKCNFNRADANKIVNGITSKLLTRMFSEFENYFLLHFDLNTVQYTEYCNMLKFCRNPFVDFQTYQKFIKTLKDN